MGHKGEVCLPIFGISTVKGGRNEVKGRERASHGEVKDIELQLYSQFYPKPRFSHQNLSQPL